MGHRISLFLFLFFCTTIPALSQIEFSYNSEIKFIENGKELKFPFAGGLNSAQYGSIDLNLDNIPDLVVFDRSSDKLITFISTGSEYEYAPQFEHHFPPNIQNWMVLADYNCDGKMDIFTYTNLGIRVFKNISTSQLEWELAENPIFTQGSSSMINLSVNSTDIPAVVDLDGDSDLDILVYNFASGGLIEHHKNMAIENNGNCNTLEYVRVSQRYGDFEECTCDEFVFSGESCNSGGRTLHVGGKAILAFDNDNDGDLELVIGQETCTDLSIIENKGTSSTAVFDSFSNFFPEKNTVVSFEQFPAPFLVDVNFDGLKDIILSPCIRSNPGGLIDNTNSNWLYINHGSEEVPDFKFDSKNFLQANMIDVGDFSYPTFLDVDGDLDEDLLVGNQGTNKNGNYSASIRLYSKTVEGFVLTEDDYASLSHLNFTYLNSSFVDINEDGKLDMVITALDENDDPGLFYILNTSTNNISKFEASQIKTIPTSVGAFDNAKMFDINSDGVLDLLLGKSNGKLEYYVNTGSNLSPNFTLENDAFLGLEFRGTNSNLNITVADVDGDNLADLITTDRSGVMKVYLDFVNSTDEPQINLLKTESSIENTPTILGRITHPSIGKIDGKTMIAIGNIRGGITLLESNNGNNTEPDALQLTVFPNPSKVDKVVKFHTTNDQAQLEIFGISGNRLLESVTITANEVLDLNLSGYRNGLYFARIRKNKSTKTVKFILGNGSNAL
ncbi:T9SS type A sorting domain-containing protein [Reichenbachiella sp. MALMAid0571]|uniref:T9SS type A sorting domain-containing protein n=1 Tax=Reichenbachiella sp. MALMAid0571 TaxID=3143939 RepID=UPI0032DF1AF0